MSNLAPLEHGPCDPWITADDIAACCGDLIVDSTNQADLDQAAEDASFLLYQLSGRQFAGVCGPVTVRPCHDGCGCWGGQMAESPGGPHWLPTEGLWGWNELPYRCGCSCDSRVILSGYPVREVTQVLIDGAVVPATEYQVDGYRWLTRLADAAGDAQFWPGCQRLDLPDTEAGTWSVTYLYGMAPPGLGISAASALGCQLYNACTGGDCKLPSGAVKIIRTGVTIERVSALSEMLAKGATGILPLDAFLAAVNPQRLRRRPAVWSPASHLQYPRREPA